MTIAGLVLFAVSFVILIAMLVYGAILDGRADKQAREETKTKREHMH